MVAFRRLAPIVPVSLALVLAGPAAAPASAQLIDLDEPIQLPDVRQLPIVRDVPIVQQLPDVRELPVVRDVTAPAPTPSPAPAPAAPSPTAVPQSTPAPAGESGGGSQPARRSTAAGDATAADGGAAPRTVSGGRDPAPAASRATGGEPADGVRHRTTRPRAGVEADRRATGPTRRRERRLRETVRALSGCLGALDAGSRRVLVLRAGIGRHAPLSRRAVAERLDATTMRVARSERRAIVALRAASRAGRCGAGHTPAAALGSGTAAAGGDAPAPLTAGGDGDARDRIGAAAPAGRTGVKEEFRTSPPAAPQTRVLRVPGDAPPLAIVLGLAFLAGFGAVWTIQRRRRAA